MNKRIVKMHNIFFLNRKEEYKNVTIYTTNRTIVKNAQYIQKQDRKIREMHNIYTNNRME